METSLHRALKTLYAGPDARFEVPVEGFRIDVVSQGRLVEIQHGPLGAIRDKVRRLLQGHDVTVVKPVVVRKLLVKRACRGGRVVARRQSPKRGSALDLFHDLVHFTRVFPHPRLTLEAPLVEIEEWRYPGHGRRRRWRVGDFVVEDQRLVALEEGPTLRTAADLAALMPGPLPDPFHTADLARALGVPRWMAQRIAYCLRQTGAAAEAGKQRNTRLYAWAPGARQGRAA